MSDPKSAENHVNGNSELYIIVPVHNRKEITGKFIKCLEAQTFRNFTLVLVDDGSTDGTSEMVLGSGLKAEVVRGDGSLWWAGGLQAGLNRIQKILPYSADPVVGFMNDDVEVRPPYLEQIMAELAARNRGHALATPGVYLPSGRISWETYRCEWHLFRFREYHRKPEKIHCATTRGFFFFLSDAVRAGPFLPKRVPHYASDFEYTLRLHRTGVIIHPAAEARGYFNEESTGDHGLVAGPWRVIRKKLFSPRFSFHPVYMFHFIMQSWHWFWKPVALLWYSWSLLKFLAGALIVNRLKK